MDAPTILEKRPLSPTLKTPQRDEPASSPAKRRRVNVEKQFSEAPEVPASPVTLTNPNSHNIAETVAFVERAFSAWKAFAE
jgi:hypothetical protein